ncbi:MAG: cellulose synthase catalytic subunit [Candidatus Azobacteroides sp.]|nr:cellulose synthase catalytic subunit [Candidatus Azobacteroides sp.]
MPNKKNIARGAAIIIYILLSILYVIWRIGYTLNADQMIASVIFLFVDMVTCFSAIVFVISLWRRPVLSIPPCNDSKELFSVDVLVPTCNETCEMLESTLRHCIDMDCPHKTYLLDDGNRPEMKLLAKNLDAGYIAREKNIGAKAGNLNNAMQYTQGELIAVFDADFRPEKEFLSRLTRYFHDEKTAVVQVPQFYYNTDSFQHRRLFKNKIYSDQDMFMHLVLPARHNWNAAYWIGTNALLRREAIESIGGFPTDCVTEDILTSMFIHGKGWKTVYIDEPLAYGFAPVNIFEYYVQRLRWAKGAFQILRSHNPLFQKGLSLMQRLFYFSSVSHFFEESAKTVYYLFPAFFFLFGIVPIYPYPPVIVGMLLYFGITRLLLKLITGRHTNLIMNDIYSVIKSFIYCMALPAFFFNKNIRFKVTPKGRGKSISFQGIIGTVIIFGFNLAAVVRSVFNLSVMNRLGVLGLIVFGWCLYIGGIAFSACFYCFKPLIKKSNESCV